MAEASCSFPGSRAGLYLVITQILVRLSIESAPSVVGAPLCGCPGARRPRRVAPTELRVVTIQDLPPFFTLDLEHLPPVGGRIRTIPSVHTYDSVVSLSSPFHCQAIIELLAPVFSNEENVHGFLTRHWLEFCRANCSRK